MRTHHHLATPRHRMLVAALMHPSRWASQLLVAASVVALLGASGCGFALRQNVTLPFRTITLSGFAANSPLATELAQALEARGVDVVESSAQAAPAGDHVVLEALSDGRQQVVASSTAFGQVRDLTLRTALRFRVLRLDGSELLPPAELTLARDQTYNEKDALAKQSESEALHRAMQTDIVAQVLRRLAVITPERLRAR